MMCMSVRGWQRDRERERERPVWKVIFAYLDKFQNLNDRLFPPSITHKTYRVIRIIRVTMVIITHASLKLTKGI